VRRGTGVGLTVASCLALAAAWKIGEGPAHPAQLGLKVVSPASTPSDTTTSGSSAPASSASASSAARSKSTSSTPRSYDGATVQTQYGDLQVRVVMTGSRLTDVIALRLTDSSSRSVQISASAAPILRREALAAQSAHIDSVSGASYTSAGYIQSLQSALDAARAG
jgi:uncharacterized protein with FMN-binding domain